ACKVRPHSQVNWIMRHLEERNHETHELPEEKKAEGKVRSGKQSLPTVLNLFFCLPFVCFVCFVVSLCLPAHSTSGNSASLWLRSGWRSFNSPRASIWRMRSRVIP